MKHILKVACIQNNATPELQFNLDFCSHQIRLAAQDGARFIATPEYFSGLKSDGSRTLPVAFDFDGHPVIEHFRQLAIETNTALLLGSVGVICAGDKIRNRSVLLNSDGEINTYYDKIHMFDVDLGQGRVFRESATMQPGDTAKISALGDITIGMSICYDLRFPHLYRQLAQSGAMIITVPAAFTHKTGSAHWHTLLRARAIENACFIIAPGQTGYVSGGGRNFGHSLIINPWGEILAEAGEDTGYISAEIDLSDVEKYRKYIPSLNHPQEFSSPEPV